MSRADLSKKFGLTRAAITIIVDSLISEGIIIEKGTVSSGLGRSPIILDINPGCYYALGLNISRDSCSLGLVNIKGKVLTEKDIRLDTTEDAVKTLDRIRREIKNILKKPGIAPAKILGLGITSPGPLDSDKGIIMTPPNFMKWKNTAIVSELKKTFSFSIMLENNASALALAEKNYGAAREFSDFILLVVDTGVGAGIITDNTLYKGSNSLGAELGHTSIMYNGKKCGCGNNGCLEVYASIPAILEEAQKTDPEIGTWKEIISRAEKGDESMMYIINKEAEYLAASLVSAVNILGIEAVVLSGYITYRPELLLDKLSEKINSLAINRDIYKTDILTSSIEKHAEILAAASVLFNTIV